MRVLLVFFFLLFATRGVADELPDSVLRALDSLGLSADDVSVLIRPLESAEPVLSHLPATARNPASVMKLVTTWSALELLGPAYTWPTEIYFLDDFDGRALHGDLGIKGYGDPFLVVEEMWKLLRGLRRLGLEEIQGDLWLDATHFDVAAGNPGDFDGQPYRTYNVPPSALLANFKAARFQFFADPANNGVRVTTEPDLGNLQIRNNLRLTSGPCRAFQAGVAFNIVDPAAMSQVVLDGNFADRCSGFGLSRTVLNHDTFFFGVFQSLWREVGGRIRGDVQSAEIPESASLVLTWQSPPLGEIIRSINKNSNNVMTRQLLLTVGAERSEPPGTVAKGVAAIESLLTERGVNDGTLAMDNGAGLSRDARVSAQMLVDMLAAAAKGPYAAEFIASLSLAGEDGTTRGRFERNDTVLHVKTGRLDDVSALAGYAHAADGRTYVLAIMANATDAHRGLGQEFEEAVLRWLDTQI